MKQFNVCILSLIAVITFGVGVAVADQEGVTLKVAHFLAPGSNDQQKILVPWCDKISKESGGKLKCQIYPAMQLGGTPAQLFDQARDGIADIVFTAPSFQAGRFTKSEVFLLPFMISNSEKGSPALWDYINKNAMDEYKGVKLIEANFHDIAPLHLRSKSVKTMEDLKGLKIRSPNRFGAMALKELGAIPVQMPAPAVAEAISKNVVDGVLFPLEASISYKLHEICKTHTEPGPGRASISNNFMVLAMNQAKYDSLSPELKKVIDNNSGRETSRWVGKSYDSFSEGSRKMIVAHHNTINVLSDAEYKRWVKATEPVFDEWRKEVKAKGGDGKALLIDAKALLKKYNYNLAD